MTLPFAPEKKVPTLLSSSSQLPWPSYICSTGAMVFLGLLSPPCEGPQKRVSTLTVEQPAPQLTTPTRQPWAPKATLAGHCLGLPHQLLPCPTAAEAEGVEMRLPRPCRRQPHACPYRSAVLCSLHIPWQEYKTTPLQYPEPHHTCTKPQGHDLVLSAQIALSEAELQTVKDRKAIR